jgi:hypothetical protein
MTTTRGDDINLVPENSDFYFQDEENVNVEGHNDDTGNTTAWTTAQATGGGTAGNGPTNFNLRVEQNKIPEFFGAKSKDTISAVDFIRRLEDLAKTNRWMDAQTYHYFANSLRNPAREWLSSIVQWNLDKNIRLLWSNFKDLFKQEYAVQTNDKLILEGLSNLAMKPNETTNELLTRITRTTWVIRESFDEYDAKIPYLHNDVNGGISNNAFRTFLRQYVAMWINFFKMNLFKAALTPELISVVAQQEQETITIKRMYQVATTAQQELKGKGPALVNKIREEEIPTENETDDIAAFSDEGPDPETIKPVDKTEEAITPDEEDINQDQAKEEILEVETTATGMANTATSAKFRGTDKKNAARGWKKINHAEMLKDDTIDPRFTSWRRTKPKPSTHLTTKK